MLSTRPCVVHVAAVPAAIEGQCEHIYCVRVFSTCVCIRTCTHKHVSICCYTLAHKVHNVRFNSTEQGILAWGAHISNIHLRTRRRTRVKRPVQFCTPTNPQPAAAYINGIHSWTHRLNYVRNHSRLFCAVANAQCKCAHFAQDAKVCCALRTANRSMGHPAHTNVTCVEWMQRVTCTCTSQFVCVHACVRAFCTENCVNRTVAI